MSPEGFARLHLLFAGAQHLPVSFVADELRDIRDEGGPEWRYARAIAQNVIDHPKAYQVAAVPLFRDIVDNDPNPDPTAVAREAKEFAAFWRKRLEKNAVSAMQRVETLAANARQRAGE